MNEYLVEWDYLYDEHFTHESIIFSCRQELTFTHLQNIIQKRFICMNDEITNVKFTRIDNIACIQVD